MRLCQGHFRAMSGSSQCPSWVYSGAILNIYCESMFNNSRFLVVLEEKNRVTIFVKFKCNLMVKFMEIFDFYTCKNHMQLLTNKLTLGLVFLAGGLLGGLLN